MVLMGRAFGPLGQLEEAERSIREGLELRTRLLPKGDWKIASARSILGAHFVLARRFTEAEALLLDAERDLVATLGNDSAIVADARRRLVGLYTALGRPSDASRWQQLLPPGRRP